MELFVEGLSCNSSKMAASSPSISIFLATNLEVIDDDIEVMLGIRYHNMSCDAGLLIFDIQIM